MMNATIKKLQYKLQEEVLVISAPPEFRDTLAEWKKMAKVHVRPAPGKKYSFAICFVKNAEEVKKAVKQVVPALEADAVSWMAYPKKTSRKYKSDITRDHGWESLGEHGYEGVAMVSVDDDWSAFRFRKVEFIKTMQRRETMAMSEEGKKRLKNRKQ